MIWGYPYFWKHPYLGVPAIQLWFPCGTCIKTYSTTRKLIHRQTSQSSPTGPTEWTPGPLTKPQKKTDSIQGRIGVSYTYSLRGLLVSSCSNFLRKPVPSHIEVATNLWQGKTPKISFLGIAMGKINHLRFGIYRKDCDSRCCFQTVSVLALTCGTMILILQSQFSQMSGSTEFS